MTPQQAVDAMFTIVRTAAALASVPVVWRRVPGEKPASGPYLRPNVLHADGSRSSLAGDTGTRLHDNLGVLWLELYVPTGDGGTAGYTKGKFFVDALRQYKGSIWFRRVRLMEAGADGNYDRFDVKADFEYSEVN